jgi:hypothetical protein
MPRETLLGIPNSILTYFGAPAHHATLPVLDRALTTRPRNVVLLVLDGMGNDMLTANIPDGFFARNRAAVLPSVYPCTTTAAITTFVTGLSPAEHGWLGWSCYFREIDQCVDLFSGVRGGTKQPAADPDIVDKLLDYTDLRDQIRAANPSVQTHGVSAFAEIPVDTCEEACAEILALCARPGPHYIYAYLVQPDSAMHKRGCYDAQVKDLVASFDRQIEHLAAQLSDTLLIVTADHGLTDCEILCIEDFPELHAMLTCLPSREPRSLSFFVKDECKERFPALFRALFGREFALMTGQQALSLNLFGEGPLHPKARDFVGDFVALATGKIGLWYRNSEGKGYDFAAAHAGLRAEEMLVPLILVRT